MSGAELADVADVLGHDDITTTKRYYAHISPPETAKKRADAVTALMVGGVEPPSRL